MCRGYPQRAPKLERSLVKLYSGWVEGVHPVAFVSALHLDCVPSIAVNLGAFGGTEAGAESGIYRNVDGRRWRDHGVEP